MIAYLLSMVESDSFPDEKWDFGFVKEALEKNKVEIVRTNSLPECERAFVVICGYENRNIINQLSKELSKINKVVLLITSDEGGTFLPNLIKHNDIKIWVQSPYIYHKDYFKMPIGTPSHMKDNLPEYPEKKYDLFFSGQITHSRRQELAKHMVNIDNSLFNPTAGFTQGYTPKEYYEHMSQAKIVPAPAGSLTIDSFRLYEAIEMLAVPIGDIKSSANEEFDFWNFVFNTTFPAPETNNWENLKEIKDYILSDYPKNLHRIVSWWIKYKRDFANKIMDQINEH